MVSVSEDQRRRFEEGWLETLFRSYPSLSVTSLLREKDPFRNPVGYRFREGVRVLTEELFGAMDARRIASALENIVQIRAVQDFSPAQALGFVFASRKISREILCDSTEDLRELDDRIDRLILAAFDLYVRCREKVHEVQLNETRRKVGLLERLYSQVEGG
ncbi:MAG TPA: RsbRD N-terminal domain-containing protein [Terriglobia bacterium]|nr:RsbRD N-terminal domain-containing protein [Terriglobia bacterium]